MQTHGHGLNSPTYLSISQHTNPRQPHLTVRLFAVGFILSKGADYD